MDVWTAFSLNLGFSFVVTFLLEMKEIYKENGEWKEMEGKWPVFMAKCFKHNNIFRLLMAKENFCSK